MADTNGRIRPLIAGNWKMNGLVAALGEAEAVQARLLAPAGGRALDVLICPPATLVGELSRRVRSGPLMVGGQDCHAKVSGAHTGDVSAEMLKDAGATFVIVGHSERRTDHAENDSIVRSKAMAAHRAGLVAIVCVGETAEERKAGRALAVVGAQLAGSLPDGCEPARTVVAYEPVWAIGSGLTPTVGDVREMHGAIRQALAGRFGPAGLGIRILYGGSVKPSNAAELLGIENVNGALVGGASLKAADFLGIIDGCPA